MFPKSAFVEMVEVHNYTTTENSVTVFVHIERRSYVNKYEHIECYN